MFVINIINSLIQGSYNILTPEYKIQHDSHTVNNTIIIAKIWNIYINTYICIFIKTFKLPVSFSDLMSGDFWSQVNPS